MADTSIIVRTKNEERWIGHCLAAIFNQDYKDFEVVLVDNNSDDHTVEVAKRYPISKVLNIENFLPGKALNLGIGESKGQFIVCISAHCVPRDETWLSKLRLHFEKNNNLAGVYGRQLPISFTEDIDKRDLLTVFGLEPRLQKKDYFFHNANSMIRRDIWEQVPFDDVVSNIEDRVWGQKVISMGYELQYDPEAAVFHHHGLNQGNSPTRAKGVVSILEKIDKDALHSLPETLKPENASISALLPIRFKNLNDEQMLHLKSTMHDLKNSKFIKKIYLLSFDGKLAQDSKVEWIDRKQINSEKNGGLEELLTESLAKMEEAGNFPEAILYLNFDYLHRPVGIFDEIISKAQYSGCDTVFPALIDYGHYWVLNEKMEYYQVDNSMKDRVDRDPVYKALYGQGCLTSSSLIRSGKMIGGKIGILALNDEKFTQRATWRVL